MKQLNYSAGYNQTGTQITLPRIKNQVVIKNKSLSLIKKGIWAYFLLLIFEGALRKWILPGWSAPLLIARDPIAIWLIIWCIKAGVFRINFYIAGAWLISFISFLTAVYLAHGSISIALFGARILVIHFPLIFIIGRVFDRQDVIKAGKVLLWITPFMTVLLALQFFSPQSAWVNRGIGGDLEGTGFTGAMGFFRASGTFSFTTGLASFYSLVACYIFYFWVENLKIVKNWLLVLTMGCLLAAIPLSISRTLFFQTIVTSIFAVVIVSRNPKKLVRLVFAFAGGAVLLALLSNFSFFQTGIEVFSYRLFGANEAEGGTRGVLIDRFLGGMYNAITNPGELPFWGYGLGLGTNAGAALQTGEVVFLISEGEWGRLIGEMGLLLGLAAIFLRVSFVVKMTIKSFFVMRKGSPLPWLLLSFGAIQILQGQWAQPTALGFAVLIGGLILAALNDRNNLPRKISLIKAAKFIR